MIEFISDELLAKVVKINKSTNQSIEQIKVNIELNKASLESAIKIKEEIISILESERTLYKKNMRLVTDAQIVDLQHVIEDFGIADKNFSGENVMLDMINAKRNQLDYLENVVFEHRKMIAHFTYTGIYMLATQESLLRVSQKIHKFID